MWREQRARLSREHSLLAINYPGFARPLVDSISAHTDSTLPTWQATPDTQKLDWLADELIGIVDQLGYKRFIAVGTSMGGYLAFRLISRYSDRLCGAVLTNTRAAGDSEKARTDRLAMIERIKQSGTQELVTNMPAKLVGKHHQPGKLLDEVTAWVKSADQGAVLCALAALAYRPDSTADFRATNVPTLLVAGADDTITPADEMRQLATENKLARFELFEQTGHLVPIESPDKFTDLLRDFATSVT